jgi:hypothetical protein
MTTDHGPGVTWLAQRAGTTPEKLLHDGSALGRALEGAGRDAVDLARRLMSADETVRKAAEVEARALRAALVASDGRSPEDRFRERIAEALRTSETPNATRPPP